MQCTFTPLEHEGLIHISGPDALTFLQGQTTCDTREIGPGRAIPGAYCTVQGRVTCDFLLLQLAHEHYALRMRHEILEQARDTFARYIVFSKAGISAGSGDWLVTGVCGPGARGVLEEVFGSAPDSRMACQSGQDFALVQTDTRGDVFECYLATDSTWIDALTKACAVGSQACWRFGEISSGIARIERATLGEFVPQALNYDLTGHVNFNKGCYTGQEVVARLHYRGKSKRRAFLFQLPAGSGADREPAVGATVFNANGKAAGQVLNSAICEGHIRLLAAASLEDAAHELYLDASHDNPLEALALPYPLGDN